MKGYLFLIIAILSMTFFSCEKETETETEKTATNNDNNNDYFYVKYQISNIKYQISGSTYFFYIDGVSYNTENGSRSESFSAARSFEVICGPVNKNFVARITLTQYRGAPASNATKISVSKNNGPFAIKASGQSSASYTINF